MEEQVYKKRGRKYIPIGYSDGFTGFPAEGIWLVTDKPGRKSMECIIKIDELENLHPSVDLIYGYRDKMVSYITEYQNSVPFKSMSAYDFVTKMLKEITKE